MIVRIRRAKVPDADHIARLSGQLGYDIAGPAVAERLERILARPDHPFLVADVGGRCGGWIHAVVWEFVETGAFVAIGGLVVDASLRRRGVGRQLMVKIEGGPQSGAGPLCVSGRVPRVLTRTASTSGWAIQTLRRSTLSSSASARSDRSGRSRRLHSPARALTVASIHSTEITSRCSYGQVRE